MFSLLNLILCFELIVGPHIPGSQIFTMDIAKAETCPPGLVFDSVLNRCITSDQNAQLMAATSSCSGDKECYKRLAEEELKKGEEEDKIEEAIKEKSGLFNKSMKIAAIVGPLTLGVLMLVKKKTTNTCSKISMYGMIGASVALLAGNLLADSGHRKRLEKIREDWDKKKDTIEGKTEGQSEAFEMLAKQEDSMAKAAKQKGTFYTIALAAFAASAVAAVIEMASIDGGICPPDGVTLKWPSDDIDYVRELMTMKEKKIAIHNMVQAKSFVDYLVLQDEVNSINKNSSSFSLHKYNQLENDFVGHPLQQKSLWKSVAAVLQDLSSSINFIPEAHAQAPIPEGIEVITISARRVPMQQEIPVTRESISTEMPTNTGTAEKKPFYANPKVRAAVSGVLAGWSGMMMAHANKQARVSENRANFLRKIKKNFVDAQGAISCSQEERNLSTNANCYCYTDDGKRNQARQNSSICKGLFNSQILHGSNSYDNGLFAQKVCVTKAGSIDEKCSCRASKSCGTSIGGMSAGFSPSALNIVGNGLRPANDFMNGNLAAAEIDSASATSGAIRALDAKKALVNKLPKNKQKELRDITSKEEQNLIEGGKSISALPMASNNSPLPLTPSEAARELEKEIRGARKFEAASSSTAIATPGNDGSEFSLSNEASVAPTTDQKLAEVMTQYLNYGQNDITKSDTNIFNILSNRYQRSGMRRLFDEDGKASPEAANKTDISQ